MSSRSSIYDDVNNPEMPKLAQGEAKPIEAGSIEAQREAVSGYTNPNLHRRVETPSADESGNRVDYKISVFGKNSYRSTVIDDVPPEEDEIP